MLSVLWSAKGGVGVTTTVVSLAAARKGAGRAGSLLVDLVGDLPAAVGLAEPEVGLAEWMERGAAPEALSRIELPVAPGIDLLPFGTTDVRAHARPGELAAVVAADHRDVVVDAGLLLGSSPGRRELADAFLAVADRSLLVTRPCYLALRRAARGDLVADGVVLIREPGRALDRADVEALLSVPVLAEVDLDAAVARSVDAGLLASHPPRHLSRSLRRVA